MTITDSRIRPATQRQFDFIKRLLAERTLDDEHTAWVQGAREEAMAGRLAAQSASSLIDALLALPKRVTCEHPADEPCDPTEAQAGIYTHGGVLYRVYLGQQSGKMLVKRVETERSGHRCECHILQGVSCRVCRGDVERDHVSAVSYEYLGTAARHLPQGARRLTVEQVGEIGIAWNHCVICGHRLDVPESVDRGIGPVCARKYDA